jgi:glycosyltransferase involved in cell wall biosynthesis
MKGRVLIVHALIDGLGGSEIFALRLAQALIDEGFQVDVLTSTPVDSAKIREIYGESELPSFIVKRVREAEAMIRLMPGRLIRLRRLLVYRRYRSFLEESRLKYDLVIDTQSNLPTPVDISYIHFPVLLPTRSGGLLWSIYNSLVKLIASSYETPRSGRVLANSTWTAHMVYRVYGIIPDVLYPPVDIDYFSEASRNNSREKIIVTISRFSPEKKLEKILDAARELPDYTFVIVGSTGLGSEKVIEELEKRIDKLKLRNVELKPNLPRSQLRELLEEALFYLHPEFTEHFGIAVVEAMSAGCIPIVYRDGGVWHDAVSKISEKLGYSNIGDAPKIIRQIEKEKQLQEELRKRSIEVSKTFSYDNFKKNLAEKVYYILKIKKLY